MNSKFQTPNFSRALIVGTILETQRLRSFPFPEKTSGSTTKRQNLKTLFFTQGRSGEDETLTLFEVLRRLPEIQQLTSPRT
jgi:hypothetical protein